MTELLKILKELKNLIGHCFGPTLQDVILFGSQAASSATVHSDVDILILLNKPYTREDENKILELCYEIDLKYSILLDVHIISKSELNTLRGKQPIYYNAIKHGVYA